MGNSILIVEDDEILADNFCTYLQRRQFDVMVCSSAEEALTIIEAQHPDLVLTDYCLPGLSGCELISRARAMDEQLKLIMITGHGNVQGAVEAMKAGASDYLTKPVALAELKLVVDKVLEARRQEQRLSFYQQREAQDSGLTGLIGDSEPMRNMKDMVRQVLNAEERMAGEDLPVVLIEGETGTGKELVARALHFDGARSKGPFVEFNCASIPSHLLEAELFGHEKGAFTDAKDRRVGLVEAADGGTLFLDEVGEIDLLLQAKLLKLLEDRTIRRLGSVRERKVNLRIISATNCNLEQMVQEGKFRRDLFFRLRIITVKVPPLRARGDDILTLAEHFVSQHGKRYGKPGLRFSQEAKAVLKGYSWPGNVRELRNMLEQTVLLAPGNLIGPEQLTICRGLLAGAGVMEAAMPLMAGSGLGLEDENMSLSDAERDLVVKVLGKTDWNISKSARMLGLTRDMLRYRIDKLGLERPDRQQH
ncbi:sigma-54 dependent transcriptional regulator [Metapseudomonas resinovorans]|uniref:Putative transcriptional regulator n=1 Tax=Metapseudomonas resinovorans NBRC 106553 TaxID=1245471 RepID=S6BNV6_METRE|nr:sigma-54 dependent transcriptional regulator [Pseudomonas resinovorans]BAN50739.1 putative transcriptional regulator [Pseudomonas resinovorans NBRC 106553]